MENNQQTLCNADIVKKSINEILCRDQNTDWISDDMHIIDDIGLSSLQVIEFILKMEEKLNIEFAVDSFEYENFSSDSSVTAVSPRSRYQPYCLQCRWVRFGAESPGRV